MSEWLAFTCLVYLPTSHLPFISIQNPNALSYRFFKNVQTSLPEDLPVTERAKETGRRWKALSDKERNVSLRPSFCKHKCYLHPFL